MIRGPKRYVTALHLVEDRFYAQKRGYGREIDIKQVRTLPICQEQDGGQ